MSKKGVNKSNVLSMDSLKEKHSQEFKMSEAWVDFEGEMLSYKYYEKLPETKKNEYIQEFMEFNFKLTSDEDYKGIKNSSATFALILLIDKFTDMVIPEDDKEKIIYAGYLSDFGLLNKIIETLPEDEIVATMEKGSKVVEEQTIRLNKLLEKYQQEEKSVEETSSLRLVEKDLGEEE